MSDTGSDIEPAARLLTQGEVVAIPTETVYGLAGNALNPAAVAKIFAVKNRPTFNPLITHTNSWEKIKSYVQSVPPIAEQLAEQFWPGPLTMLLPKTDRIPDIVTAGLDRVAVRIPRHPLTQQLLEQLDFPLAAPSANPFGYISPTEAAHVADQLGDKIPYILDGGVCSVGVESTIIGFEEERVMVYRWGGVSQEELQWAVGEKMAVVHHHSPVEKNDPEAPGMLRSHYAPTKKVIIGSMADLLTHYPLSEVGVISFQDYYSAVLPQQQMVLSKEGDLAEAAQRLFSALRTLEKLPIRFILAEPVPNIGLGRAINDRLKRASA